MSSSVLPRLLALSDLHVAHPENRRIISELRPESERDWLLLAGDVGELSGDIEWVLGTLSERFATVVWTPGNHELWTRRADPVRLRGEERYLFLVEMCRRLGVITPEDPYPVWEGPGGAVTIAPVFLLYDYSFRPDGAGSGSKRCRSATRGNGASAPGAPASRGRSSPRPRRGADHGKGISGKAHHGYRSHRMKGSFPRSAAQPVVQRREAAAGALVAYRRREGPPRAGQHDELPGPGDAGIEQVALEHYP